MCRGIFVFSVGSEQFMLGKEQNFTKKMRITIKGPNAIDTKADDENCRTT